MRRPRLLVDERPGAFRVAFGDMKKGDHAVEGHGPLCVLPWG